MPSPPVQEELLLPEGRNLRLELPLVGPEERRRRSPQRGPGKPRPPEFVRREPHRADAVGERRVRVGLVGKGLADFRHPPPRILVGGRLPESCVHLAQHVVGRLRLPGRQPLHLGPEFVPQDEVETVDPPGALGQMLRADRLPRLLVCLVFSGPAQEEHPGMEPGPEPVQSPDQNPQEFSDGRRLLRRLELPDNPAPHLIEAVQPVPEAAMLVRDRCANSCARTPRASAGDSDVRSGHADEQDGRDQPNSPSLGTRYTAALKSGVSWTRWKCRQRIDSLSRSSS